MKTCLICQKKIKLLEYTAYIRPSNQPLCETCMVNYNNFVQVKGWKEMDDEVLSNSIAALKEAVEAPEENPERRQMRESIKYMVNKTLNGANSFLELQQSCQSRFKGGVSLVYNNMFEVNEKNRLFALMNNGKYISCHKFEELLDYEIIREGREQIFERVEPDIFDMMLLGYTDGLLIADRRKEVIQYAAQLGIRFIIKGLESANEVLWLIDGRVNKDSAYYRQMVEICNEIASVLKKIKIENEKAEQMAMQKKSFSPAEEIVKFKILFEEGIITEEEFREQKEKLLGSDY